MDVELEDLVKCRDYKLEYVWGCHECYPKPSWDKVKIYIHRTEQEYKDNKSNVNQICRERHVSKPFKICSKCMTTYDIEETKCPPCEDNVRKITEIEVGISKNEKRKSRLKSLLKKHRITKEQYDEELLVLEQNLIDLKERRNTLGL